MYKLIRLFDRSISGSIWRQLLWLIVFVAIVFLFWFGLSYLLFDSATIDAVKTGDDSMSGLNNAIKKRYWGILSHLFDPGNLHMATPELRIFTLFIAFSGSVLLSGLLISTFSNSLERRIDKIKTGQLNYKFSGHYIIMGYSDMVPALLIQLANRKENKNKPDLVLHTSQHVPDVRRKLKTRLPNSIEGQITILQGGRDTKEQMVRLRVQHAREIFIVGESGEEIIDTPNVECLILIADVLGDYKSLLTSKKSAKINRIRCHVSFHSQSTFSAFQFMDLKEKISEVIDFFPNNFHEMWARNILVFNQAKGFSSDDVTIDYDALDYHPISSSSPLSVHLIIVGFSRMGMALTVEAIRTAHFANGKKTRITIIDKTAATEQDYFNTRYPYYNLINEVEINFIPGGIETKEIRKKLLQFAQEKDVLPTIAICFTNPNKCLTTALTLPLEVYQTDIPILVNQEISYSLISLLNKKKKNAKKSIFNKYRNVAPIGMTDQCFNIDRNTDLLAKAVSYFYNNDSSINGNIDISVLEENWKKSSLINKWSNRFNADSFNFKIRAVGLETIDFKQPGKLEIPEFTNNDIDTLAKMEHARWNAERILAGYHPPSKEQLKKYAKLDVDEFEEYKNELKEKMIHLCIVPFDKLRPEDREIDYKLVRAIPAILKLYKSKFR